MTTVRVVAATHTGLVREKNEDHYGATALASSRQDGEVVTTEANDLPLLVVVADGLGGHPFGEVASAIAVDQLLAAKPDDPEALVLAIHEANRAIVGSMSSDESTFGMGTTIAAVLVHAYGLTAVNVGDSPILELTDSGLVQISTDDTPVGRSALPGLPSNVVTQTLGGGRHLIEVDPHVHTDDEPLPRRVLLCSDGLTNFVPRHEIADILRKAEPEQVVSELVAAALEAGAPDNVTCALVDVE